MRWILVFLFLYLIPLTVLFKNYGNFKRSCLYSSIYAVLVSTIVITNIYISGLNKIKEAMYYQSYALDYGYSDKEVIKFNEDTEKKKIEESKDKNVTKIIENESKEENNENLTKHKDKISKENETNHSIENSQPIKKSDKDIIVDFKKEIYEIETIALIPMRDCMPYTKNISENIKNLVSIKKDLEYAHEKCEEVIEIYTQMDIPKLLNEEDTEVLNKARNDVKKAYELRNKAMEQSLKLVETKNPKYVGKITEYLKLSDKQISNFKERLKDLNDKID